MRPLLFILSAIAAVLHSSNAPPQNAATSLEEQSQTDKQVGYIDAYVATLRTNPNKPRTIDAPALTNPALIQKWLQSMTVKQYLNLTDDSRNANSGLVWCTCLHNELLRMAGTRSPFLTNQRPKSSLDILVSYRSMTATVR